jgi:hypothetical protein
MEKKQYDEIKVKLFEMTPSLVEETLRIFQEDPDLVQRFEKDLARITEQEVTRLRDIMLGALMLNYPQLLGHEVKWLIEVATVRNFNLETVRIHLKHYRTRLSQDLPSPLATIVLELFDEALGSILFQLGGSI